MLHSYVKEKDMFKDIKIAIPCLALAFLLSLTVTVLFTAKPAGAG